MITEAIWLLNNIGAPKGVPTTIQFDVEYVTEGGGYSSYAMRVSTLSEMIEEVFKETVGVSVGRMIIEPSMRGQKRNMQLLNFDGI
jgi:hypothetical protein